MKCKTSIYVSFLLLSISLDACSQVSKEEKSKIKATEMETATFGSGCFWCVEAIFQMVNGVVKVESGYSGGTVVNPTYEQVCSGTTGHAEVCQITYNPSKVSFTKLLEAFWSSHDPTTLNRQGNDTGTQYRSAIFSIRKSKKS